MSSDDSDVTRVTEINARNVPAPVLRVKVAYSMTMIRVNVHDKALFDTIRRMLASRVDEPVAQHELFAVLVEDAAERFDDVIARWGSRAKSVVSDRAYRAAVDALAGRE